MKPYWLLGIASILAAQPALAQYRGTAPSPAFRTVSPRQSIDELAARIEKDVRSGRIRAEEGRWLRAEIASLRRLEARYGRYEFTSRERTDLARRIDRLGKDVLAAEQRRYARTVVPRDRYQQLLDRWDAEDARRNNRLDAGRSLSRDDRQDDDRERGYYRDADRDGDVDMNDLRGPPPSLRDEDDD
jgi:hypothetical protein